MTKKASAAPLAKSATVSAGETGRTGGGKDGGNDAGGDEGGDEGAASGRGGMARVVVTSSSSRTVSGIVS
jgi:hypothetical protein